MTSVTKPSISLDHDRPSPAADDPCRVEMPTRTALARSTCPPDLLDYAGSLSPPNRRDAVPEASLELLVQRVLDAQRETREDVREIKTWLGRLESDVARLHVFLAELSVRMDRFGDRLEGVERRLEIADA